MDYDFKRIEKKWQKKWEESKIFEVKEDDKKKKFYVLEMFPYPSASGLHMGHALNYAIGDVFARFKRMKGFNVLYPMGFDSFGLPAENAAIKAGQHPREFTKNAIKNYIRQMKEFGLSYDWSKIVSTMEPEYYVWNQYFFLKMLEKGLIYRKKAPVNFCEECNTVLANEQVHDGKCWRHENTEVQIKQLEQWFIKTTAYAEELLEKIDALQWPDQVKVMQKNWIGKSQGSEILFEIEKNISKVVLMHGKNTSPNEKWYPWFAKEIKKRGIEFIAPKLLEADDPEINAWMTELDKTNPDKNTILVGHSRGGVAILRWLEKLPKGKKIKKVILISVNSGSSEKRNKTENNKGFFTKEGYDFEKIKSHCSNFVVIHSKDDKWVPFEAGEKNAKGLGAEFKVYENKGHFGIKESPQIPELLEEIISREKYPIFTTRPDTIYGVTFMVISAQHSKLMDFVTKEQEKEVGKFLKKIKTTKQEDIDKLDKEGVFTGSYAINPINGEKIPVWAGNFVVADYGSGRVMGVPAHDKRDFEFAKKYEIPIKEVVKGGNIEQEVYTGSGILINSDKFNGLDSIEAKEHVIKYLKSKNLGKKTIQYKLRDWLVSRQRYWGTPIPVIYCEKCGIVPVPEKDLPVLLPEKVKFGKGNPLATNKNFVNVECPKCGKIGKRETDTMDTFFDSSWYYLRYCDNKNNEEAFSKKKVKYWMPVDQYIGGIEHACMHLIYARFFTKALRDLGFLDFDEPFTKLFNQGMLHGPDGEKMSKSKGNVINPDEVSKKYGMDTARFFLLSLAAPDKPRDWNEKGIEGSLRFIKKIINYFDGVKIGKADAKTESKLNKAIKDITKYIEGFNYNLAIIKIRDLFDSFPEETSKKILEDFLRLLQPFCPHITEELWEKLGNKNFISLEKWSKVDEKKIDKNLEKQEQSVEKLISDINHVVKLVNEKQNKEIKKVFVYVLPNEKKDFMENVEIIKKKTNLKIKIYAVNDKEKYDPENKSKKVKPNRPAIFLE